MNEPAWQDFDAYLDHIRAAPTDDARLELIVRRPKENEREVLDEAHLDLDGGLVGDNWAARVQPATPVSMAAQITVATTRVLAVIEPDRSRWPLAGDQLYVDLDLSVSNLPVGSRFAIGSAVLEVSETPHTGCAKFSARFGADAMRWINSPVGLALRMRGLNARIVTSGVVRVGDRVRKL